MSLTLGLSGKRGNVEGGIEAGASSSESTSLSHHAGLAHYKVYKFTIIAKNVIQT